MSATPPARRRRSSASGTALLGLPLIAIGLAGCSDSVRVEPFAASDSDACRAVAEHWPVSLLGEDRRVVAVQAAGVAVWGDPQIVARCGARVPQAGPEEPLNCLQVNGVDWIAVPFDDGTGFVSYGREPAIEVLVPDAYAPESSVLPALEAAASAVEATDHCY